MTLFRSLYGRFTLAFVAAFAVLAVVAFFGIERSTRLYHQEATQRLHRDLAAWIVEHYGFDTASGLDATAIEQVFHDAMNVNPTIELYLLDTEGRIRAFNAPPGSVQIGQVDMAPLRAYFSNPDRLPVLGNDPRHPGERRPFSVAPIGTPEAMNGYLYAVIGGEEYQGLLSRFRTSHVLRITLIMTLAALLAGASWALLSFAFLTRRVRGLARALESFHRGGFAEVPELLADGRAGQRGDELDRLSRDLRTLMERTVKQMNQLRDSDSRLREMIASLSHDLRTPLASLGCYLETLLLKDQSLTPGLRRSHLHIALRHHGRLRRLIDALFELAQLEFPDAQCELQPTDIADLLMDIGQKCGLRAAGLGVSIETILPHELPQVFADAALLERALENLIDNALQHTPRGGQVRVYASLAGSAVRVIVQDTGIGIPPEHLPHVFERFYRVDRSRPNPGMGAGLGLAITRRIVELHGGRVSAQSKPGVGSAFSLTLRTVKRPAPVAGGVPQIRSRSLRQDSSDAVVP